MHTWIRMHMDTYMCMHTIHQSKVRPSRSFNVQEEVQTPEELWQVQDRYQKAVEVSEFELLTIILCL